MWVVPLFLKLGCFVWKCHPRTDVNSKPQRWLMSIEKSLKRWQYKFPVSGLIGIEISKMVRHKLKLVLRYHHLQTSKKTLRPRPFWPLRNSLTSFAIKLCISVNCPSEPEKLHCLDITQTNEAIEATNCNHSPKNAWSSRRWARGLANHPWKLLCLKNFIPLT